MPTILFDKRVDKITATHRLLSTEPGPVYESALLKSNDGLVIGAFDGPVIPAKVALNRASLMLNRAYPDVPDVKFDKSVQFSGFIRNKASGRAYLALFGYDTLTLVDSHRLNFPYAVEGEYAEWIHAYIHIGMTPEEALRTAVAHRDPDCRDCDDF